MLVMSDMHRKADWPIAFAFGLSWLSLLGFIVRGWSRLRKASLDRPIQITEVNRIRELIIGPKAVAIAWSACTILLAIGVIVVSAVVDWYKHDAGAWQTGCHAYVLQNVA